MKESEISKDDYMPIHKTGVCEVALPQRYEEVLELQSLINHVLKISAIK